MCIVCAMWRKGELTPIEAWNAVGELIRDDLVDPDHIYDVRVLIEESEDEIS